MSTEVNPGPAAGTDYIKYLLIDDLLELQQPLTPGAHDEILFIVVHQAYELWFKLMIHELKRVQRDLSAGRPQGALPSLQRTLAVERLLQEQLSVLETMGPDGFMEFRDPLAPASGFQSWQYREIEWISGRRDNFPVDRTPPDGPSLYEAFCECCRLCGLSLSSGTSQAAAAERVSLLADLYRSPRDDPQRALLHQVAERLIEHDENLTRWRFQHMLMAARQIGIRQGTGGSRGVEYLSSTIAHRFFPELWEVRNAL